MKWNIALEKSLRDNRAPRRLTVPMLMREQIIAGPITVSKPTMQRWIRESVEACRLYRIRRGLYLNRLTQPFVSVAEAAQDLYPGSIVSLQYVLGKYGIAHNYTDRITLIAPIISTLPPQKLGVIGLPGGTFHARGMPVQILNAGTDEDRLDSRYPHFKSATPEKAIADWLYLGHSKHSNLTMPPLDFDFEGINEARLKRLADAMGISNTLRAWRKKSLEYVSSEEVDTKTSSFLLDSYLNN